ncbi:MAG: hypothetical protein Q4D55_09720 [Eubacteriales bacterium]|nr:hypothetical protein [Eubacteriales bacterium]
MKKGKVTALLLTAIMGLSAPVGAQAAPSYQEAEKAALAKTLEAFISNYSQQYSNYPTTAMTEMSLELHDAGRSFLGFMTPHDVSWLNDLSISADVGFDDSQLAETMDFLLNGSKICTMEIYLDSETLDTYVRIPQLADGYLKSTMEQTMGQIEETESAMDSHEDVSEDEMLFALQTQAFLSDYMKALPRLNEFLPKPEALNTILDRYASILIDHTQETESGTDSLTVEHISQECTTLDATLTQEEASAASDEILSAASKDEELKAFIQGLEALSPQSGISYDGFLEQIDSLRASLAENNTEDGPYIASKIWLDAQEQIVGRQFSMNDGEGEVPLITWKAPSAGDASGCYLQLNTDDQIFEISGTGVTAGQKLKGTYEFSYNGQAVASVDVADYDAQAMEEGAFSGTYEFRLLPGIGEEAYASLGSFGFSAVLSGDQTDAFCALTLTSSQAPMATLSISSTSGSGSVEFVDFDTLDKVYDTSTEEGLAAFQEDMHPDTIMENLTAAGMPQSFLEDLMSGGAEPAYYEEAYTEEAPIS